MGLGTSKKTSWISNQRGYWNLTMLVSVIRLWLTYIIIFDNKFSSFLPLPCWCTPIWSWELKRFQWMISSIVHDSKSINMCSILIKHVHKNWASERFYNNNQSVWLLHQVKMFCTRRWCNYLIKTDSWGTQKFMKNSHS